MFPFSVTHPRSVTQSGRQTANSGYELIAFDAEKLNVFAAEVRYCEPHWHPAPELITVLAGRGGGQPVAHRTVFTRPV